MLHSGWVKGFVADISYSRRHRTGLAVLLNAESDLTVTRRWSLERSTSGNTDMVRLSTTLQNSGAVPHGVSLFHGIDTMIGDNDGAVTLSSIAVTPANPSIQAFLGVPVDGTTLDPGLGLRLSER